MASAVVLAATSAAVVLTHGDQERTDSPAASAGPEEADGAAPSAGGSDASPAGSERAPTVIAGSRLVPSADGVGGVVRPAIAPVGSTSIAIGQVPGSTAPDGGSGGGDPDDGGSADPLGIEVDPGSGRVRIVLVVPGEDEPIVIETPAAER